MAEDAWRQPVSKRRHRRGGQSSEDDNGSLTYSAGSSINSGNSSAAGESTDSSFSDIMRVLALQDGPELEALMKKEGVDPRAIAKVRAKAAGDTSVTSSLNYSTDGESALNGEDVLQTITGQPSDSYGPDGGGIGLIREHQGDAISDDIVFAPADPVDPKHRKGSKVRTSPRDKGLRKKDRRPSTKDRRPSIKAVDAGTPPPAPRRGNLESRSEEDSLWYAKWWMCGFTDALRELVPKR